MSKVADDCVVDGYTADRYISDGFTLDGYVIGRCYTPVGWWHRSRLQYCNTISPVAESTVLLPTVTHSDGYTVDGYSIDVYFLYCSGCVNGGWQHWWLHRRRLLVDGYIFRRLLPGDYPVGQAQCQRLYYRRKYRRMWHCWRAIGRCALSAVTPSTFSLSNNVLPVDGYITAKSIPFFFQVVNFGQKRGSSSNGVKRATIIRCTILLLTVTLPAVTLFGGYALAVSFWFLFRCRPLHWQRLSWRVCVSLR